VGRSGVGKTTVLESWLAYLQEQGYRVGVVKHSHHPLADDPPDKDSARLRQSLWTGLVTPSGMQIRGALDWIQWVEWLSTQADLVLVEGGKHSPFLKIEVVREQPPMLPADQVVATLGEAVPGLPHLPWRDPAGWTRFWQGLGR
jgi:molybdopterin-guanine dinucleotide biosynthesis protein B